MVMSLAGGPLEWSCLDARRVLLAFGWVYPREWIRFRDEHGQLL